MKTFEEYINEERQDYIFGGTDNRNIDMQPQEKTFAELERGDKIYWWGSNLDNIAYEFDFTRSEPDKEKRDYMRIFYPGSGPDGSLMHKNNFYNSFELNDFDSYYKSCTATTFKELKEKVKEAFNIDVKYIRRY